MEKIICPNCGNSKVKYKHNHPLNYNCEDCGLMFYDSRLEDAKGYDKGSLISEWAMVIVILLIVFVGVLWLIQQK